jgi:micrococcal nuclease
LRYECTVTLRITMNRRIATNLILLAIVVLNANPSPGTAAQSEIRGPVVSVRSCSEVLVSHQSKLIAIRIAGIDCPGLTQPSGPEAKAFVATLLNKRTVIVRPTGHDRHRRLWGEVLLQDGRSLGIEMLKAGWAQASATAVDERLSEFEQDARRSKLGLWKETAPVPVENVGTATRNKSPVTDKPSR